ncbi:hypothetical protein C2E21_2574 [Chlorella sorokiniana]|uniref:Uncharacterized protein n=1 Tax=Chlorella sorokiniana TaxID=3076 RepID=A0A2P6TZ39_CHLSO|nr:hypothetical protein C2E21_2574 [Chlorella sorokiniana]|eukprot:PRW59337.1 hypothetical protein C2E21_2574 [Chlorella sorokiniana]
MLMTAMLSMGQLASTPRRAVASLPPRSASASYLPVRRPRSQPAQAALFSRLVEGANSAGLDGKMFATLIVGGCPLVALIALLQVAAASHEAAGKLIARCLSRLAEPLLLTQEEQQQPVAAEEALEEVQKKTAVLKNQEEQEETAE